MGSWTFNFDALNRLQSAQNVSTTASSAQYQGETGCWTYDEFGNRLSQGLSNVPCSGVPALTFWADYSANNQFVTTNNLGDWSQSYDAAGDVIYDGYHQYLYDGDGRVCAVRIGGSGMMTGYLYDADGSRIAKGTISQWSCDPSVNGFAVTTDYVLGLGGEQVTEMQGGVWQHTNVFAAGKLMATYDGQGLHFYLDDPLGTRRAQTNYAGVLEQTCSSLPFGDELSCTGSTTSPTEHHFTGKERDTESGNDYFGARYYGSWMGRFMSPDPSSLAYADPSNPQSLNLYSYVLNNPLIYTDPTGKSCQGDPGEPQSDDGDGKGCAAAGINPDGSETTHTVQAQVNSDGSIDMDMYYRDYATMQRNQMLMAQQPAQIAPSAREFIRQVAKDTAALPNVCGVGVAGYIGGRVAGGLSADTQSGVQIATGANIATVPFGATGFGVKSNVTFTGGANGNVSYQAYALGGAVGSEVGTKDGDALNAIQSVSVVGALSPNAPHNFAAYANISNMGDPACRPKNP